MSEVLATPKTEGLPGYASWVVWTAPDHSWEVSYGDDGDGIFTGVSGNQVITVSSGRPSGQRWFETSDPRGLAAALLAAAEMADAAASPEAAKGGGEA